MPFACQDRPDHRAGEGVYRAARRDWRPLCAGAGLGRDGCQGHLRPVHACIDRGCDSCHRGGAGAGPCGPHSDDHCHVRHRRRADGIEGSVRSAPRGQRDREDSGGVEIAADAGRGGGSKWGRRGQQGAGCGLSARAAEFLPEGRARLCLRRGQRGAGCRSQTMCATPLPGPRR